MITGMRNAMPLPESTEALKVLAASLMREIASRDTLIARREDELRDRTVALAERDAALARHRLEIMAAHHTVQTRTQELATATVLIDKLKFELARLRRWRFGASSEAVGAEQISLWESELEADIASLEARLDGLQAEVKNDQPCEKRKPKRLPLPDHLARIESRLEPQCTQCCGLPMHRIGEDVAETLQVIPAKFFVERRIRGKWACRCCERIAMAPVPGAVIDKGVAGSSVLAQVVVAKFQDHQPLHRQEGIYARMGVTIARSTMAGWLGQLEVALEPLAALLRTRILEHTAIQADETPVPVLAPGTGRTATGYLWAYRTMPTSAIQAVSFDFAMSRAKEHPKRVLKAYSGTLQVDGYAGYHDILSKDNVIEAGCWAHARRKYVEVYDATKSPHAQQAITRIAALYAIEREIKEMDVDDAARSAIRQARAGPLLKDLHQWLMATHANAPPRAALAKAIGYTLNRWAALTRYVKDGRLPPDTNAVENAIRGIALGRRNWLFAGSQAGGERAATMYSLIESAKMNGIVPLHYLRDVFDRLPTARMRDLEAMLPWNWQPARVGDPTHAIVEATEVTATT